MSKTIKITIECDNTTILKASNLWSEIQAVFLADGPVSVVEIEEVEAKTEVEKGPRDALVEALKSIANCDDEDNEWDAVEKFHFCRATARSALLEARVRTS